MSRGRFCVSRGSILGIGVLWTGMAAMLHAISPGGARFTLVGDSGYEKAPNQL